VYVPVHAGPAGASRRAGAAAQPHQETHPRTHRPGSKTHTQRQEETKDEKKEVISC